MHPYATSACWSRKYSVAIQWWGKAHWYFARSLMVHHVYPRASNINCSFAVELRRLSKLARALTVREP